MKIGIDISQTAFRGSGVDRYTRSLIEALLTYDTKNEYVFFYSSLRIPLDPSIKARIKKPHSLKEYLFPPTFLSFLWNTLHILPIEFLIGNVDVFISSDWVEPPSRAALKITTLHDMVVYRYPETAHPKTSFDTAQLTVSANIVAQQRQRHAWVVKESEGIFADSECTKKEAVELLNVPPQRLHVLYPAVEIIEKASAWEQVQKKYGIDGEYILTVGKREPRKNLDRLIEAFSAAQLPDTKLIVIGDYGWGDTTAQSTPEVVFPGYVPDNDLAALYAHALFFVFPSLYEGFGYPVIEAMGYGCAVATSDTSSLAEIADDAALLFDPTDTDSIKKALKTLAGDAPLQKSLAAKGAQRYKKFSPRIFAANFDRILQTIYHDNRG